MIERPRNSQNLYCDHCKRGIGSFPLGEDIPSEYKGINHGVMVRSGKTDHICSSCKSANERAYDRYVDPIGAYR